MLSGGLVMWVLARKDRVPAGTVGVFVLGVATSLALAGLAYLRALRGDLSGMATLGMVGVLGVAGVGLFVSGGRHGWLPDARRVRGLLGRAG